MTRRVVVTGLGIVASIGNNAQEVSASLKAGKSGIVAAPQYAEYGFRSQVEGSVKIDLEAAIDAKTRRFMGDAAAYTFLAMEEALRQSGLEEKDIKNERTGLIVGSGGPSTRVIVSSADITRERVRRKFAPRSFPNRCRAPVQPCFRRISGFAVTTTQSVPRARLRRIASATRSN